MSATSMANVAIDRNLPPARRRARGGARGVADAAEGGSQAPDSPITAAMKTITTYIPTEILTLYIAGTGVFFAADAENSSRGDWFFWGCAVATPVVTILVFLAKLRAANLPYPSVANGWPIWECIAATIAFIFYAAALEQGPFTGNTWYEPEVAGFLVLVVTAALGLVAAVVSPTAAPADENLPGLDLGGPPPSSPTPEAPPAGTPQPGDNIQDAPGPEEEAHG